MKIAIASDHAGFNLKSEIINYLNTNNQIIDFGCSNSTTSVDYPDFAKNLCKEIGTNDIKYGILICGSGIGISIAANRFSHIRAALCHNQKSTKLARQHNDANILCLGARSTNKKNALKYIEIFLNTKFSGGRHIKRVSKLSDGTQYSL